MICECDRGYQQFTLPANLFDDLQGTSRPLTNHISGLFSLVSYNVLWTWFLKYTALVMPYKLIIKYIMKFIFCSKTYCITYWIYILITFKLSDKRSFTYIKCLISFKLWFWLFCFECYHVTIYKRVFQSIYITSIYHIIMTRYFKG